MKLGKFLSYKIKYIKIEREDLLPKGYTNTIGSLALRKWIEERMVYDSLIYKYRPSFRELGNDDR